MAVEDYSPPDDDYEEQSDDEADYNGKKHVRIADQNLTLTYNPKSFSMPDLLQMDTFQLSFHKHPNVHLSTRVTNNDIDIKMFLPKSKTPNMKRKITNGLKHLKNKSTAIKTEISRSSSSKTGSALDIQENPSPNDKELTTKFHRSSLRKTQSTSDKPENLSYHDKVCSTKNYRSSLRKTRSTSDKEEDHLHRDKAHSTETFRSSLRKTRSTSDKEEGHLHRDKAHSTETFRSSLRKTRSTSDRQEDLSFHDKVHTTEISRSSLRKTLSASDNQEYLSRHNKVHATKNYRSSLRKIRSPKDIHENISSRDKGHTKTLLHPFRNFNIFHHHKTYDLQPSKSNLPYGESLFASHIKFQSEVEELIPESSPCTQLKLFKNRRHRSLSESDACKAIHRDCSVINGVTYYGRSFSYQSNNVTSRTVGHEKMLPMIDSTEC